MKNLLTYFNVEHILQVTLHRTFGQKVITASGSAAAAPVPAVVEIQLSDSTKKNLEMSGFNQVSFHDPSLSPSCLRVTITLVE